MSELSPPRSPPECSSQDQCEGEAGDQELPRGWQKHSDLSLPCSLLGFELAGSWNQKPGLGTLPVVGAGRGVRRGVIFLIYQLCYQEKRLEKDSKDTESVRNPGSIGFEMRSGLHPGRLCHILACVPLGNLTFC